MTTPSLYAIPGSTARAIAVAADPAAPPPAPPPRTVAEVLATSQVESVIDELDRELVGLAPVKQRIRDVAALLVIDRLRLAHGLQASSGTSAATRRTCSM